MGKINDYPMNFPTNKMTQLENNINDYVVNTTSEYKIKKTV